MDNFLEIYVCEKCKRFTVNTNEKVTPIKQCFHQDGVYDMTGVYMSNRFITSVATTTVGWTPDNI